MIAGLLAAILIELVLVLFLLAFISRHLVHTCTKCKDTKKFSQILSD